MTSTDQLEMKIHKTKDQLGLIEYKLEKIAEKIDALIEKMNEHEMEFQLIQDKLNDL